MPFESYLAIASVAIAAAGLGARFLARDGAAKRTLITAVLIFLALIAALQWHRDWSRTRHVRALAGEIIDVVGNEKRTYEDIVGRLRHPDHQLASAAIDLLITEERLGSEAAIIVDRADKAFPVRLYFARSF